MISRKSIVISAVSLGFAFVAQTGFAASNDHVVTQAQIEHIHSGISAEQARQILGAPESTTNWGSGTSSMVYEFHTPIDQPELVYVNLDKNNTVKNIRVISR